jgi:bifunctional DNase/RNase
MQKVKINLQSVSAVVGSDEIGLLVLTDEEEERQITITCDRNMLYQFGLRMRSLSTGNLLPEILWQIISESESADAFEILITNIQEGKYTAILNNNITQTKLTMRASDAVLLSSIGHLPIYIDATLMEKQSSPYEKNAKGVSLPINVLSDDILNKALENAINNEDYELASHLRDELKKREKSKQ